MSDEPWFDHFIQLGAGGTARYGAAMQACTAQLTTLFERVTGPYSGLDPAELLRRLHAVDFSATSVRPLDDVLEEVSRDIASHAIVVQHPNCIAHLHTPPLVSSLAAERFIAAQNLSMDSWDQSGAATFVEQKVVGHLCGLFGYPDGADGVFTSGGTQSNIMALLMARDWFLWERHQYRVQFNGLGAFADRLRIVASAKSHFTVDKAASVMGLGQKAVVKVPVLDDGSMDANQVDASVDQLLADGLIPFALVGTAGTTDHGAIDDLGRLAAVARRHGMWFHVDGAYGSALVLCEERHRLAGLEQSDSLTVDFHKMWFQTVSCGTLLLREGTHFRHLLYKSEYLNRETDDLPNLVDKTLSTTRRFDALKVYVMLRAVGTEVLGRMVDHLLRQTRKVADLVRSHSRFELMAPPRLSTLLFRYVGPAAGGDKDAFNRRLRAYLLSSGQAVLGETTITGRAALKLTLLNPCLRMEDFDSLLSVIGDAAERLD
jgi:diaminobutyrate-2-oxoglutarate transaminase/L-2,4-diaminobutyrate decarboxylase